MRSLNGQAAEAYVAWLEDGTTPPPLYVVSQAQSGEGWFWLLERPGSRTSFSVEYVEESDAVLPTLDLAVASAWRHFEESNQ